MIDCTMMIDDGVCVCVRVYDLSFIVTGLGNICICIHLPHTVYYHWII